ncbi:hypothetical protein [Aquimarina megaterium]|uniref:hypothetical protein n=1 Tax=Aquimarina megaterium TaxID=1443666 RepID=UPI000944AB5D|nr:hypothetical protein [Aquimarina megaterium]
MKKTILFCLSVFLFPITLLSQNVVNISFDTTAVKYSKANKDQIIPIKLKIDSIVVDTLDNYLISIEVDKANSTLSNSEYDFFYRKTQLSKLNEEETTYLTLKKDTLPDRDRKIILDIKFYKNDTSRKIAEIANIGICKKLTITVAPLVEPELKGYEYLAYIGTNFDLVDGIQAKDLFFAANIFSSPERTKKKKVGFYLSLYGNRAISQVDSSLILDRVIAIDSLTENSFRVVREKRTVRSSQSTDNLGAYISPLIKLKCLNTPSSELKLYYSPSLEFVYRRTRGSIGDFVGTPKLDSITVTGNINDFPERIQRLPEPRSFSLNEYSFNLGAVGLFLNLENKRISVRVHGSVGYASNYFASFDRGLDNPPSLRNESDVFFTGRAWITEPTSGITLQAEVTNSLINSRPFFVATLSKAIDFKNLGSIFSPITSR